MSMTHIPDDLGDPRIENRFLGLDKRLIGPTLGILALVIFWGGVIPALNEAIEGDPLDPSMTLTVASVVEFEPAEGWRSAAAPVPSNPELTLFKDGVSFTVSPGAWNGTASELLDELEDEYDPTVTSDRIEGTLPSGLMGVGVDITAGDETGFLSAWVSDEYFATEEDGRIVGIRIEATTDVGFDDQDQEDIAEMLATLRVIPLDERGPDAQEEDGE